MNRLNGGRLFNQISINIDTQKTYLILRIINYSEGHHIVYK